MYSVYIGISQFVHQQFVFLKQAVNYILSCTALVHIFCLLVADVVKNRQRHTFPFFWQQSYLRLRQFYGNHGVSFHIASPSGERLLQQRHVSEHHPNRGETEGGSEVKHQERENRFVAFTAMQSSATHSFSETFQLKCYHRQRVQQSGIGSQL